MFILSSSPAHVPTPPFPTLSLSLTHYLTPFTRIRSSGSTFSRPSITDSLLSLMRFYEFRCCAPTHTFGFSTENPFCTLRCHALLQFAHFLSNSLSRVTRASYTLLLLYGHSLHTHTFSTSIIFPVSPLRLSLARVPPPPSRFREFSFSRARARASPTRRRLSGDNVAESERLSRVEQRVASPRRCVSLLSLSPQNPALPPPVLPMSSSLLARSRWWTLLCFSPTIRRRRRRTLIPAAHWKNSTKFALTSALARTLYNGLLSNADSRARQLEGARSAGTPPRLPFVREYCRARQICMGDWTNTPARAALDFSCPPKMRNIIEISKLRKNNEKWACVGIYVIYLHKL